MSKSDQFEDVIVALSRLHETEVHAAEQETAGQETAGQETAEQETVDPAEDGPVTLTAASVRVYSLSL